MKVTVRIFDEIISLLDRYGLISGRKLLVIRTIWDVHGPVSAFQVSVETGEERILRLTRSLPALRVGPSHIILQATYGRVKYVKLEVSAP